MLCTYYTRLRDQSGEVQGKEEQEWVHPFFLIFSSQTPPYAASPYLYPQQKEELRGEMKQRAPSRCHPAAALEYSGNPLT